MTSCLVTIIYLTIFFGWNFIQFFLGLAEDDRSKVQFVGYLCLSWLTFHLCKDDKTIKLKHLFVINTGGSFVNNENIFTKCIAGHDLHKDWKGQ